MDKDRRERRAERTHGAAISQEPSAEAREVVFRSPLPVLMLHLPSERIVAASAAATALLADPGEQVVGRTLSEFADGTPSDSAELLAGGRLNGYQTARSLLPVRGGTPLTMWVRAIGTPSSPTHVVALLFQPQGGSSPAGMPPEAPVTVVEADTVVGTTNNQLVIDRIGENVYRLLGDSASEVTGRSLLRLAHPADLAGLLSALAEATASGRGVTLSLRVLRNGLEALPCQLTLLPLSPAPACVFALERDDPDAGGDAAATDDQPDSDGPDGSNASADSQDSPPSAGSEVSTEEGQGAAADEDADSPDSGVSAVELERLLSSLRHGVEAVSELPDPSEFDADRIPGLNELTAREFHIVTRLLAGDRAPAIADALFISKSTVRNHLSSVFAKLGVRSQQELIVLLRRTQLPPVDP